MRSSDVLPENIRNHERLSLIRAPVLDLGDAEDPLPLMEPVENQDVPWEMVASDQTGASAVWAGFYLLLTLAPLAGATLNAKRERSRRART